MAVSPSPSSDALGSLSDRELDSLAAAATWYAKYHERIISEQADDHSALAVARREQFEDLHRALRKLGVRLRPPAGIRPHS